MSGATDTKYNTTQRYVMMYVLHW